MKLGKATPNTDILTIQNDIIQISNDINIADNHQFTLGNTDTNILSGNNIIVAGNENIAIGNRNCIIGEHNTCGTKGFHVLCANANENLISIDVKNISLNEISNEMLDKEMLLVTTGASTPGITCRGISSITTNIAQISASAYDIQLNKLTGNAKIYLYFPHNPTIGSSITVDDSFATGSYNMALGFNSHVEGYLNTAIGNYGHAEGKENIASWGAHAEGNLNQALDVCNHVEGRFNIATKRISHAEGCATSALAAMAHVAGCRAVCLPNDHGSYVWNGSYGQNYTGIDANGLLNVVPYESHGPGTFNINPKTGLSGFYIGNENFYSLLNSCVDDAIAKADTAYANGKNAFVVNIDYYYSDISADELSSDKNDFYFASIELADDSNFFTIDWGDGSSLEAFVEDASMLKHTYEKPGTYCITVSDDVKTIQIMRENPDVAGEVDPIIYSSNTLEKIIKIAFGADKITSMPNVINKRKPGTTSLVGYLSNLKTVHIKNDIQLSVYAFFKSKIDDVYMPNFKNNPKYTSIFRATKLQQIYLPSLQDTYTGMFIGCSSLIAAKFGNNLTAISTQALSGCVNLKILDLSQCETMPIVVNSSFASIPTNSLSIFVKSNISTDYVNNATYSQFTIIPK